MNNDIKSARQLYANLQRAEDTAIKIAKIYKDNLKSFELAGIFPRYPIDTGLTHADAENLLLQTRTARDKQNILGYAKTLVNRKSMAKFEAFITDPNTGKKMNELDRLCDLIASALAMVEMYELQYGRACFKKIWEDAFYRTCYLIQDEMDLGFEVEVPTFEEWTWNGMNFSQRVERNTQELTEEMKKKLYLAFLEGRSQGQAWKWMEETIFGGINKTRRLLRTEATFYNTQSKLMAYKECGVESYEYVAILDLRTSEMCRAMDGKIFPLEDAIVGINLPPLHPWCRSTIAPIVPTTIPRNGVVIDDITNYKGWKKRYAK